MFSAVNIERIPSTKWRVKYYKLNNTGEWNDYGTGYVQITKESEYQLTIINERDETILLLELCLNSNIQFHLQRNTIITWSTTISNEDDMAISFQDIQGVKDIWDLICNIQGRDPYDINNGLCYENKDILIDVTLDNLQRIDSIISNELNIGKIKQINYEIMNNPDTFLHKLGVLFFEEEKKMEELRSNCSHRTCDTSSLTSNNNLSLISNIIKHLLHIADRDLLLMLVTDKYSELVFGALEFDSVSFKIMRHREYFRSIANFRNILDITDTELISKIHLNHRLAYLRDTAAGRFIEETSFNNINLIIQTNNSNIIRYFISNAKLLTIIITNMNNIDNQIKKDATSFLVELINCSQNIFQLRIQFLELLCSFGIFEAIEDLICLLRNNETTQWFNIINGNLSQILINLLCFVPYQLKAHIMSTFSNQINDNNTLLSEITQLLLQLNEFSVQYEIGEIIKTLLDNDNLSHSMYSGLPSQDKESNNNVVFFEIILADCLFPLSEFLLNPINYNKKQEQTIAKQIIIEILSYCLSQHCQDSYFWFIDNNILTKVLNVLNHNIKILDLQVIKFTKCLILKNNDVLNNEVKNNYCLQKMLHLFTSNSKKQNIIFSSILDLFSSIKESPSSIIFINNLFQSNKEFFYNKDNYCYFKELIDVYESNTAKSFEYNDDTLSFVGLFHSNIKNNEDDFDLLETTTHFLGKKRNNGKDIDDLLV